MTENLEQPKTEDVQLTLSDLKKLVESPKPTPTSALPQALENFSEGRVKSDVQSVVKSVDGTRISYQHLHNNYQFREQHDQDEEKINAAIKKKEIEDKSSTSLAQSRKIYEEILRFVSRRVNGAEFVDHTIAEQLTPEEKTTLDERAKSSSENVLHSVAMTYLQPDKYNHAALTTLLLSGRFEQEISHLAGLTEQLPLSLSEEYKEILLRAIEIQEQGGTIRFLDDEMTRMADTVHMLPGGSIERIENRGFNNNPPKGKTSKEFVADTFAT